MKAIRIHQFGTSDQLIYEDAPTPAPAAGEVCIQVRAVGVNPYDYKIRQGSVEQVLPHQLPLILGWDVAGDIAALGEGVTDLNVGDPVYVMANPAKDGAYAEYIVMDAQVVVPKPKSLTYLEAASIPLAGQTALQAIYDLGQLQAGQTILIHGGAGSVGSFAIQLAKAKGATVYATASGADQAYITQLGADKAIDYKTQQFEELVKDVDLVLDPLGGDVQQKSWHVLKPGGRLVSTVQPPQPPADAPTGAQGKLVNAQSSADSLRSLSALINSGQLKTRVQKVLPLQAAKQAHDLLEGGLKTPGKVVLEVKV